MHDLAIDPDKHSVEYLTRTTPGHTTGVEFKVGDAHEELTGPNGAMAYASQRGDQDLMAEFLDCEGKVIDRYSQRDFAKIMK